MIKIVGFLALFCLLFSFDRSCFGSDGLKQEPSASSPSQRAVVSFLAQQQDVTREASGATPEVDIPTLTARKDAQAKSCGCPECSFYL